MQPQGVKKNYRSGRRSRVPLSCDPCRTRKLRCNREKPCQNCSTRNEVSNCQYTVSKLSASPTEHPYKQMNPMQQRIDHLEDLVKSLIAQHQDIPGMARGAAPGPTPEISNTSSVISEGDTHTTIVDGVHSVYKSKADWYEVLQEINQLKTLWSDPQPDQVDHDVLSTFSNTVDGSSLLFGQVKPMEKIEILATLPPKSKADELVRRFFDHKNLYLAIPPIIHEPTFMREYAEHWKDPSKTNIIWLGLLFSILGTVMLSYNQFGEPPEYEGLSESLFYLYRVRTANCLIIGDIAKCLPYTLETLRLNATAELNRRDDNSRGLWIMTGVLVRAAINMGYHRESSQSTQLSALQAEYRRRVWLSVSSMDDVASYMAGFPRMLPTVHCDTLEPRNLHDWELSENAHVLPNSRPLTEATPTTYLIVKGRLFRALGRIADLNNNPNLNSYDSVLEIDSCLQKAFEDIPPHMRVSNSAGDLNNFDIKSDFSNLQLESMYHHGMCTLHRKYIAKARNNAHFALSLHRCISSALVLLEFQHFLDPSWYNDSHTRRTLTLAAMILFLELEYRRRDSNANPSFDTGALLLALEKSYTLWLNAQSHCKEARPICQMLSGMLSSFQSVSGSSSSQTQSPGSQIHFPALSPQFEPFSGVFSYGKDTFVIPDTDSDWMTWDSLIQRGSF